MSLLSPVLVGRHAETTLLSAAVEQARRSHGSSVFLVGEPGIGKTRLAAELTATAAADGVRVLRGRAGSGGSAVPFRPLSEALFSVLRQPDAPGAAELGPYWPVLSRLAPGWRPDEPAPGAERIDDSLAVRAEALLRLLTVLGERSASILLLEDLHDADADTLAVVDYLIDNLAAQPVLLLGTLRPDPGPGLDLASAAAARRAARTLRLARLTPAETAELAARCLGGHAVGGVVDVPEPVLARLHRDADGIPFVVEELLSAMVDSGRLARGEHGWAVDGSVPDDVPATVSAAILRRVERLDPACVTLLEVAAVLGRRFSVQVAAAVAGVAKVEAFRLLRAAARAQLIVADPSGDVDWYAFRHALTADAMLGHLLPGERAALCRTAAAAVQAASAELGDDWYQLAAELASSGGDRVRAAELFTAAGRLAVSRGALASAVELLDRGLELLDGAADRTPEAAGPDGTGPSPAVLADLLEALVGALALTGDTERVVALGDRLDSALAAVVPPTGRVVALGDRLDAALAAAAASTGRRAAAHLTRARVAAAAGRLADGWREVAAARSLLGDSPGPELTAPVDAVAAHLALREIRPDRLQGATELALRAVAAAESVPLPEVACEALEVLGRCARMQDYTVAQDYFERSLAVAEAHGLSVWRMRALLELGVIDKLLHTDVSRLHEAREAAVAAGALAVVIWADLHLGTVHLIRSEHEEAAGCAGRAAELARRLRFRELELLAIGLDAGLAAMRARRADMEAALAVCEAGTSGIGYGVEVWSWCRGTCALLEEDHDLAVAEYAAAARADAAVPSTRGSGWMGPYLLLRVLRGEAGWAEHQEIAASRLAALHQHQPYLGWSRAVLLGRDRRPDEAAAAAAETGALSSTRLAPGTRAICLRLAAQAALADGWGDPVGWLREAEEHFHATGLARPAAACRALLREAGAQPQRRRSGSEAIPGELRRAGVTVREYEVLRLLADRLGNRQIAERLFLSPRTVEKHVASLLNRSGQPDRDGLVGYARRHAGDAGG